MTCVMCRYYQATEPEEHKRQREAGACQHNCGSEWEPHTALRYVKHHRQPLNGWCMLNPTPLAKGSSQVCGQISLLEYLTNPGWGEIEPFPASGRESIYEWSSHQFEKLINGSWSEQHNRRIAEDNTRLKRELKAARKVSASRLARLQKRAAKDKPVQPEQESVQPPAPPVLRVVSG